MRKGIFAFNSPKKGGIEKKKRVDFEILLSGISENQKDIKTFRIPSAELFREFYPSILTALHKNKTITMIDTSAVDLQPKEVISLITTLHESLNFSLQQVDFTGAVLDSNCLRSILDFVQNHLHLRDFKFFDNFNDPLSIIREEDKVLTQKIYWKLAQNRRLHQFTNQSSNRFECPCRQIVVTQGFIKEKWATKMEILDLTGNTIFHLPHFFSNFQILRELLLANNELGKIPRFIGELKSLQVLDVTNNQIRNIPEGIYKLKNLVTLNVSHNEITKIPIFLACLDQLKVFSVKSNPVGNIPEPVLVDAENGFPMVLEYLRFKRDQLVQLQCLVTDVEYPESFLFEQFSFALFSDTSVDLNDLLHSMSHTELMALQHRQTEVLADIPPNHGPVIDTLPVVLQDRKNICTLLDPIPEETEFTCVAKISEFIWCGDSTGFVTVWNCLNCKHTKLMQLHDGKIVSMLGIPFPHLQAWSADSHGFINIHDIKKKTNLKIELFELPITSMTYIKDVDEVWVASGTMINRVSIRTASCLAGSISIAEPIHHIIYHRYKIWVAALNRIYILNTDGSIFDSFKAHSDRITSMAVADNYVWTATEYEVKVWKLQSINLSLYTVSCHRIMPSFCRAPFVASANGELMYSIMKEREQNSVVQWSMNGDPLACFDASHPDGIDICAITFSVSPDRLWSVGGGSLCFYELKRGKKTIERLSKAEEERDLFSFNLGIVPSSKHDVSTIMLELDHSSDDDMSFG